MAFCTTRFHLIVVFVVLVCQSVFSQVTFVVEQLPSATPAEDTIFISGTFNDWKLNDPRFAFRKRLDGKLAVMVHYAGDDFEYKFHRGNWAKVETNARNEYVPNRRYHASAGETIYVSILNWQDVGGARHFDNFIFYFFAIGILGIITAIQIGMTRSKKENFVLAIQCYLAFVAFVLFGRVLFEIASLKWQYYCMLLGDALLFMSGPFWYFVIASYTGIRKRTLWMHFLPLTFVCAVIALKMLNVDWLQFLTNNVWKSVSWNAILFFGGAILLNSIYFSFGWKTNRSIYTTDSVSAIERKFLNEYTFVGGSFLALLLLKGVLLIMESEKALHFFDRDIIFCFLTLPVLHVLYYAVRHTDVFRSVLMPVKLEDLEALKLAVHRIMKEKKCFRNPQLTLAEFAEIVNLKPHLLSRVINECYKQNFRDFVNKYRVEEFIEMARQDSNRRYTFLALANEVGFNSKSTFNAAFKKVTHRSPRDFFKAHKLLAH